MRQFVVLFSFLLCLGCTFEQLEEEPYVVLISIDGFRHDYAERYNAKNIQDIVEKGAHAKSLLPCYPTKTFSNHYSIATGMYPDSHGIIDSYFYDSTFQDYFSPRKGDQGKWFGGTPIWNLAERQGIISATYHWIGGEADIDNERPSYFKKFDPKIPSSQKLQKIIQWLKLAEDERPRFIAVYLSEVDQAGHDYGVDSPELRKSVEEIDSLIGVLRSGIQKLELPVNLIIVSDHGMTNPQYDSVIYLESELKNSNIKHVIRDTHVILYDSSLYDSLSRLNDSRYSTYRFDEIPKAYKYNKSSRIGEVLLVAKYPHVFGRDGETFRGGSHGYPSDLEDMHGVFYAEGPNIKSGVELQSFENIHIYPMLADLLQLSYDSTAIDGNRNQLSSVLAW